MSTCHTWRDIVQDDVYTRKCFSEFEGTGGTTVNEWVHSFVDFCLIPLSTTCSFDVPANNLQRRIYIDVSPVCYMFDQVRVDNRALLRSLPNGLVVWKKDDRNKKNCHLILEMSMNEALFACPDFVSLTTKISLKINLYDGSGVNWLKHIPLKNEYQGSVLQIKCDTTL